MIIIYSIKVRFFSSLKMLIGVRDKRLTIFFCFHHYIKGVHGGLEFKNFARLPASSYIFVSQLLYQRGMMAWKACARNISLLNINSGILKMQDSHWFISSNWGEFFFCFFFWRFSYLYFHCFIVFVSHFYTNYWIYFIQLTQF